MKHILFLATGGTIASQPTDSGLSPGLSSEELLAAVPEIARVCQVDADQLLDIDSTNIQPEHWVLIAQAIRAHYNDYDGFVITHGTDTMAYTAAALSYLIQNADKPIVLTGSQKPMGQPASDAAKNLLDAFRFACEDDAGGVYLVFSGTAIIGTRAKKTKSKSFDAFQSINYPVAAYLDAQRIVHYVRTREPGGSVQFYDALCADVFLLKLIPGMDPEILDFIGQRYRAVVIESYGVGGIPFADQRNFLKKLDNLAKHGCKVVIATQVMHEGSDLHLYEVGFKALREHRVLQAYDMTVEAAVTKLMWLLAACPDDAALEKGFYTPTGEDVLFPEAQ